MVQIQFSLIKQIAIGPPEHLQLPPLRLITSHFYITPPQPKVDVICVSPLRGLVLVKFV